MGVRKILQKNFAKKNFAKIIFCKKCFFQSEHVWSQIWCQNFFPLLGGGPSENFFSSLNMHQAKSGVKNFSLY